MNSNNLLAQQLSEKIENRSAHIAIIGLGYVGLPMCLEFVRAGFVVTGVDVDEKRIAKLNARESYILDVRAEELHAAEDRFRATTSFESLLESDVIVICVPTPLRKTKDPDLSYILSAATEIRHFLKRGQLVILESTTYPGTTDEIILPELEATGLKAGHEFFLAFSPERIDPGNPYYNIRNTPKIVGGWTSDCGCLAQALYQTITEQVVRVSSTRSAEMVKLLENTFRAINIGMVNEIAIMCNKLNIDTWEVIDAAATKPFGFMPFYPGPGLGGHCIPIDPHYLAWKLKTLNYSAKFIELADEINGNMPAYVMTIIADALNQDAKSMKGSKILVLGVAYKKNSNDVRESPALDIIKMLQEKDAFVSFHDPHVSELCTDHIRLQRKMLDERTLETADCVVIVTDHSSYDWQFVVDHSHLIVDTRNATRKTSPASGRIVKL